MTAAEVVRALAAAHAGQDWVTIPEAPNGKWSPRRCDLLAMHAWQSRKFEVHGYEVKVTRADWAKELANPAKAESWWRWCDKWSLAIPAETADKILAAGAPPSGWGLVLVQPDGRLKWSTRPAQDDRDPWPWELVAVMLSTVDRRRTVEVEREVRARTAQLESEVHNLRSQLSNQTVERLQNELRDLCQQIELFESESGLPIRTRTLRGLGEKIDPRAAQIYKMVREHFDWWSSFERVDGMARSMRAEADRWQAFAEKLGLPSSQDRRAV